MTDSYELEKTIVKPNDQLTLCRSEKALVEITKDTLAIPVRRSDNKKGYVFIGNGKLVVDTIVETEKGAVGEPVQRQLNEPFLMLGDKEEQTWRLEIVSADDLKTMGANEEMLFERAQRLLNQLQERRMAHERQHFERFGGLIFTFSDGEAKLDVLVLNGRRLVYATDDISFVSNGEKAILKQSGRVILSSHGRSFVVHAPHVAHRCR